MDTFDLPHISLWLDNLAPRRGAFVHALEWAARLNIPIRAIAPEIGARFCAEQPKVPNSMTCVVPEETIEACAVACYRRRVPWSLMRWTGPIENGLKELLNPEDICVVSNAVDPALKDIFFSLSLSRIHTNLLMCSKNCEPMSRILVLNQTSDVPYHFLQLAAQLCRRLQATPLVLTVAYSESLVRASQHQAEDIFGSEQVPATFDFVVSSDVANSVALIARLRKCTHLFIGKPKLPSWVCSFRWTLMESLSRQLDSLTCLALPDSVDQSHQMVLNSPRNSAKIPDQMAYKSQAASHSNMDRNNREVKSVQF
jgi:hypothetical protein